MSEATSVYSDAPSATLAGSPVSDNGSLLTRRFRLVLLTSAAHWRGSGVSIGKIACGLAARGHHVLVVTTCNRVTAGLLAEGVPVSELQLNNTGLREVLRLRRTLLAHGAQAIMADTPRDLRLSVLAGLWLSLPVVYRYNLNHRKARNHLGDRMFALGVKATVYLSNFIACDAEAAGVSFGRARAYRIPNGFDPELFAPDPKQAVAFRDRFGLRPGELMVLTAGALTPGKRIDRGIEGLAQAQASAGPIRYVLCGEGPEREGLRALAHRARLQVLFTGMIDQATLRGGYNAADVVLHTARETFGNVVGEAMSCGRPVVCVSEGAAPEVIGLDGKAGVLVPPDDPKVLAIEMSRLLRNPGLRETIGLAARERIGQMFSLQRMVSDYENMFAAVLADR